MTNDKDIQRKLYIDKLCYIEEKLAEYLNAIQHTSFIPDPCMFTAYFDWLNKCTGKEGHRREEDTSGEQKTKQMPTISLGSLCKKKDIERRLDENLMPVKSKLEEMAIQQPFNPDNKNTVLQYKKEYITILSKILGVADEK